MFDGSANLKDLSLNDCLEKGPNSTPHSFNILLLKFRSYPVGIVSDVEKAFNQIVVATKDCNMLKFLWFDDISKQRPTYDSVLLLSSSIWANSQSYNFV